MTSNALKEHKQKLAAKKRKINELVHGIEQHEQERDDAAKQREKFSDPKYTGSGSTMYDPTWDEDDRSVTSSTFATENETDKMTGGSGKKKKVAKKGKKKKKVAPATGPRPGETGKPLAHPPGRKRKSKLSLTGTTTGTTGTTLGAKPGAKRLSNAKGEEKRKKSDVQIIDEDVHVQIEPEEDDDDDDDEFEEGDAEEGFLHVIEALNCFENAKFIFMQRLLDYVELEASGPTKTKAVDLAYQVLNVQGQLLFLMQQKKIKCTGFIAYSKKSFQNILYDTYGNKVLKYIGPPVFMSRMTSKMIVADAHNRTLGYVKAFGSKVNYSVYNAIGERLFLVVSNLYLPTSQTVFTILCRGQKIGVVKYGWKHTFHDLNYIDYETSGIEFPSEMDEREKALLLGCLMLIEFFWYSPLTRLKLSLLFVGIFLLSLAIIVLCIPIMVDNPGDDPKTKSFYVAEKIDKLKKSDGSEIGS